VLAVAATAGRPEVAPTGERLIAKIVELNQQAVAEIDRGATDSAREHLLEAERLTTGLDVATHPLVGRTYLHLGVVEVISGGPQRRVDELFGKALQVSSDIQMTKQLAARAGTMPAIGRAMLALERARCRHAGGDWTCPWKEADADPDPPAEVAGFECRARREVPEAEPVTIRCAASHVLHVAKATLFYGQASSKGKLTALEMRRNERGWWTATIPAERVIPKAVSFCVETMDGGGRRVPSGTDARSPLAIIVDTPDACSCQSRLPGRERAGVGHR